MLVTERVDDAVRAFDLHAIDLLLKPISDERFASMLAAVKARVGERRACDLAKAIATLLLPHSPGTPLSRDGEQGRAARVPRAPLIGRGAELFMVRLGGTVTLVRMGDVDWIEADDYYAKLHVGGKTHLIRETLRQLERRLDPRQFVRVHRSAIVRIDRVRTLHPSVKGSHVLTLGDGTRVTLSRTRRVAFEAALGYASPSVLATARS